MVSIHWKELPRITSSFRLSRPKRTNKRNSPRVKSRNLIRYSFSFHNISNLVDVSPFGLRFISGMKIALGTVLHIVINLGETNTQIPVLGQVVWNRPIEGHSSGYYVGVSFVKIFKKHRAIMQEVVDRQVKKI